eukprot:EC713629.1.p1 GENE.EC713629.1~~EC713629.1.p1  ORF type:complete len:172 (+),score=8.39 EC713629.1:48-518(+)
MTTIQMLDLNDDVLQSVFVCLSPKNLVSCMLVCRQFLALANDQSVWRRLTMNAGIPLPQVAPEDWKKFFIEYVYGLKFNPDRCSSNIRLSNACRAAEYIRDKGSEYHTAVCKNPVPEHGVYRFYGRVRGPTVPETNWISIGVADAQYKLRDGGCEG